ncbi:Disease resistance protein RPS2 [Triticum urartu]|uniref:Disease resistance protein RPS2 n=1 Tax=Triticum urartu TaxID=4572 RepID=M7ZRA6_TRIUA|nr:Disease resistance protein RPS2 [Triticum urartu]
MVLGYGSPHVEAAVENLIDFIEKTKYSVIYYNGWHGLAASVVLRAIIEDPPPSLMKNFDKIIHVDCSRWKSRRALQRKIAEELKLAETVMAIFDKQDEKDDLEGLDEGSRAEIQHVVPVIHRSLQEHRCLVVFQNGSHNRVDLNDLGIPRAVFGTRILWTFRRKILPNSRIEKKMDNSTFCVYERGSLSHKFFLQAEAREIARSMGNLAITPEIVAECCMYLLSLISRGSDIIDYKWATHATKYWVCDGIVQGGHDDEAWDVGTALHQWIGLEDCSFDTLVDFTDSLDAQKRWMVMVVTSTSMEEIKRIEAVTIPPESTSFFLAVQRGSNPPLPSLPDGMFHQSENLRVLRLCNCSFNFSSPPFRCCRSLSFLGLDSCKDQQKEEPVKQRKPTMEFFHSLWVLDIYDTTWELALPQETIEQMAANMREVHVKKGRIWCRNFSWRQLQNLRKLRIIEPTCSWETDELDEFTNMVKLELLDLSGNSTMQVLPRVSETVGLKTLILDGCVQLEHVGPEGLPPSIESFSLSFSSIQEAKVSKISLVGCVHLENFTLHGELPCLEELDLSNTLIRKLDLSSEVVQVPELERLFLIGCENLHAILWWSVKRRLKMLRISNQGKGAIRPHDSSLICCVNRKYDGEVYVRDARFILSLVLGLWEKHSRFLITDSLYLNLYGSLEIKAEGRSINNVGIETHDEQVVRPVRSPIRCCYHDIVLEGGADSYEVPQPLLVPLHRHVEIGDGINLTDVDSDWGVIAIFQLICRAHSLRVHDNFSMLAIAPKQDSVVLIGEPARFDLRWCHVDKCPKLQAIFVPYIKEVNCSFPHLETIWVTDLRTAGCIWSQGIMWAVQQEFVFGQLRSIHLHNCPRLKYVLPISSFILPSLETIKIVSCGSLRQIFPWDVNYDAGREDTVKNFPQLKHIYLHQLHNLEVICEDKMFAPKLETIRIRGSWGLRRLPAVGLRRGVSLPVVDCEKDLWDNLEWDGLEAGHHPSLFKTHHSQYYKKALPRVSVLR